MLLASNYLLYNRKFYHSNVNHFDIANLIPHFFLFPILESSFPRGYLSGFYDLESALKVYLSEKVTLCTLSYSGQLHGVIYET